MLDLLVVLQIAAGVFLGIIAAAISLKTLQYSGEVMGKGLTYFGFAIVVAFLAMIIFASPR